MSQISLLESRSSSDENLLSCVDEIESSYATQNDQDIENVNDLPDSQEVVSPFKKRKLNRSRIIDSDDEFEDRPTEVVPIPIDLSNETDSELSESDDEANIPNSSVECNGNSDGNSVVVQYDDEDSSASSEYSKGSFVVDSESEYSEELDSEEENRLDEWDEPDPGFLYANDKGTNKKSRKSKSSGNQSSNEENQQVSLHKINLNHQKLTGKSVEDIIKKIVHVYNHPPDKKEQKYIFKERSVKSSCLPIVKPEDLKYFIGEEFEIKVFVQKVPKTISLLNSYGIKENATTIHSLIFHYRENEIFAVTTNQAWNVVQLFADFDFPYKIAARLLSQKGELESTNKGLVGTELVQRTTHKREKKLNPYDLLTFCTRYTAELRENASILKLSCFQKKTPSAGQSSAVDEDEENSEEEEEVQNVCNAVKGVKVVVALGNVRILKKFSTSDMLSILSVMSQISKGKATIDLDGKNEEDSTAHKKYLTPVHVDVTKELNTLLAKIIHDAISDDEKLDILDNYEFCHKHATDFFKGYHFTVYYKDRIIKDFKDEVPTIKQIVVELREPLGEIRAGTSDDDFLKRLEKVKISYRIRGKGGEENQKRPEKLMNFIDGLLYRSRDNSVFWHVNSIWCHVQDGYLYIVQTQFKSVLNDLLLIDKTHPAYLRFKWPNSDRHLGVNGNPDSKTKDYLTPYSVLPDFWVSSTPGEDFIDMLRIGKDVSTGKKVLFVYYFLPGPNYKTGIKCSIITEALMQIRKANVMMGQNRRRREDVGGSEDVIKQLKTLYEKVCTKRQFEIVCPNFRTFLQMLTEANLILAIGRENSSSREIASLEQEKVMSTNITVNDIAEIFHRVIDMRDRDELLMMKNVAAAVGQTFDVKACQDLATIIHQRLEEKDFVEGTANSITGKLLSQNKNSFQLTGSCSVNEFLYEKIIYKYQPKVCTVLSKLEFIRMRGQIISFAVKSFNLLEIPFRNV